MGLKSGNQYEVIDVPYRGGMGSQDAGAERHHVPFVVRITAHFLSDPVSNLISASAVLCVYERQRGMYILDGYVHICMWVFICMYTGACGGQRSMSGVSLYMLHLTV